MSTRKHERKLVAVDPGDIRAMTLLSDTDPEALARVSRRVRIIVKSLDVAHAPDVDAVAGGIVARLYIAGDDADTLTALTEEDRSARVEKSARAAVALARKTVSAAYAGRDSLDAWADVYGAEMVEDVLHHGTDRASMAPAWAPRADYKQRTTDADVVTALLSALPEDSDLGRVFRDAARAYMSHDRYTVTPLPVAVVVPACDLCADPTSAGRRVALRGILAHARGLAGSDSQYHALRRLTDRAIKALPLEDIAREYWFPHMEGGKAGSVTLDRDPRLTPYTGKSRAPGVPVTRVLSPVPITVPVEVTGTPYTEAGTAVVPVPEERREDFARRRAGARAVNTGKPHGPITRAEAMRQAEEHARGLDVMPDRVWAEWLDRAPGQPLADPVDVGRYAVTRPAPVVTVRRVIGYTDPVTVTTVPRMLPDTDIVTVTRPGHAPVARSHRKITAPDTEALDAMTPEEREALAVERRTDQRIERMLTAPPRGPVRAPSRRRSSGTGAMSSQVPARPSRG